ncbi:MAG: T9SS type A sorting domain-containing protein, partial [Bacteroidales bacterium]|nr:T9SS type A sorting domain-containing protein [Bacteroidales bacterium]
QDVGFAVGWNEMILKTTTGGGIIVNNQSHNVSIQRIKIYPNPTNDYFIIDLTDSKINNANIDIFDISGKIIFSKYIYNTNKFIVDGFPAGIYLIKITSNNNVTTEKVVIY